MGSKQGLDLSPSSPREAAGESRIHELQEALARAQKQRSEQAAAVDAELRRLGEIYGRLRLDYVAVEAERDEAIAAARLERERRAREALELSEQLQQAEATRLDATGGLEGFVRERMADLPRDPLPLPGTGFPEIPGFEVIDRLGQGGMAVVFKARRQTDDRFVALKLLRTESGRSSARTELFLREAAVMLHLEHPGLVRALDAGECAYGRYLVLEYVDGEPLGRFVRREGPLTQARAVEIALEVAEALRYCARADLIHRDVKPSNLILSGAGRVLLCDFGLAALEEDPGSRPYGSPGYAAPEQLLPGVDVDERADMYALGCTLWHLVVGRRAFGGPPREAFTEQRRVDLRDPRFEGADVSASFAQVLRKMGRRARDERYRRWDECILDLTLVQKGNPAFAACLSEALAEPEGARPGLPEGTREATRQAAPEAKPRAVREAISESTEIDRTTTQTAQVSAVRAQREETPHTELDIPTLDPPTPLGGPRDEHEESETLIPALDPLPDDPAQPVTVEPEPPSVPVVSALQPPTPDSPETDSRVVLPDVGPPEPPLARGRWAVLTAGLLVAAGMGAVIDGALHDTAADVLARRARRLAAEGEPEKAAERLREASKLLPPADARRLRQLADELAAW